MRNKMEEDYKTFFCTLCDGKNHAFFNFEKNNILVDYDYCRDILIDHKELAIAWNIKLIEFLELI